MATAEPMLPSAPAAVPAADGHGLLARMRVALRHAGPCAAGLRLLDAAREPNPALEHELRAALARVGEGSLMCDDALRLIKVWLCHRSAEEAERDYYLHAFERAEDRAEIRRALGIALDLAVERLVLLITVDCLRGDRLSCRGHGSPTSPAIDALAAEGVYFPRAYSTAGQTAQSFPAILLSNFFQNFGRSRCVPDHLVPLAEVLSAHGFHTAGVNAANPHVSHFYGYDRGFDEFTDYLGPENFRHESDTFTDNSPRRMVPPAERDLVAILEECKRSREVYEILKGLMRLDGVDLVRHIAMRERFYPYAAADLVKETLGCLRRNAHEGRQFHWLHLMDLHENITVPFSRLGTFGTVQRFFLNTLLASGLGLSALRPHADKYRALYDSAISYVDLNVQVLRNFLVDSGLWDGTLLCLTADHGQELLEEGAFGHGYDRLAEGVVHVPLIFAGGLSARIDPDGRRRPVSTLDVSPTILDACGIAERPETFLGKSLNDTRPRPVCGQTFYAGADNRCTREQARSFELRPFPAPVRECCAQMTFCIQGGHQVVHDAGRGQTEVRPLRSCAGYEDDGAPPDAGLGCRRTQEYLDSVYAPPPDVNARALSADEAATLEVRLQDLGYL